VYTHLINAEKMIDTLYTKIKSRSKKFISITPLDFNKDSRMDVIIESDLLNLYINPSDGGSIFELDYKPKSYNLLNTLTRWPEAYHTNDDIEEEEIMVDRYKKNMLRLRFFLKKTSLKMLEKDQYKEYGSFIDGEFAVIRSEKDGTSALLELEKKGFIIDPTSKQAYPCNVLKKIKVEESQITILIKCKFDKAPGKDPGLENVLESLELGIDLPFFFNGEHSKFQWESNQNQSFEGELYPLLEPIEFLGNYFKAYDETYNLNLEYSFTEQSNPSNDSVKIDLYPIIAFTFTDEGYKKIYQGINLLPRFNLKKGLEISLTIDIL
jgi:hypothetical protein